MPGGSDGRLSEGGHSSVKVLYVGGTGTISASCVAESVRQGSDVYVLNRGQSSARPIPAGVTQLTADLTEPASVIRALADRRFDAVVNYLTFTPEQASRAVDLFGRCAEQYVHISTASLYQKPVRTVPAVESTPRENPFSQYSQDKIAVEDVLLRAEADGRLPLTIVRPAHTYDDAKPPFPGEWTVVDRIVRGDEVVVPGDGTSLWTLTHARDFALGLVGLLGNPKAVGETFHITSDEALPWDEIYRTIAEAAGVALRVVHIPSEFLPLGAPDWRWSNLILGDLRYSTVLDNTKIRSFVPEFRPVVPWAEGARRILGWRANHLTDCGPDPQTDAVFDRLVTGYHQAAAVFRSLAP
jgi:nucleoside-diphosphate-sugar epimerase